MKDLLIEILNGLGYPVFQQGSMSDNEAYPAAFFTFWNNETFDDRFYDNKEHACVWLFDVNFYANDPELVDKKLVEVKEVLKKQGFIISGKGYDVASDETAYIGRGMQVIKKEEEN